MEGALVVLVIVVLVVAVDAIGRFDERRTKQPPTEDKDPALSSSQKIVVDLTRRD